MERLKPEGQCRSSLLRPDMQQLDAFKALEDPAHGGTSRGLVQLIRNRLPRFGQARAEAVLSQAIDRAVKGP